MFTTKYSHATTRMLIAGTLLLSVLSFFTTFFGLAILVQVPLALAGSLGLQVGMLGVAWNLLRVRDGRRLYVAVFLVAASVSVFFSYANFDANLKANTVFLNE